jgi:hypothetical protein
VGKIALHFSAQAFPMIRVAIELGFQKNRQGYLRPLALLFSVALVVYLDDCA